MNSQGATVFEPSVEWTNEDDCDTLLLYLPGFVKEQLKVQLKSRTLIISGQRKLQDNTWTQFRKEFQVGEHCDANNINAKFEGSILYVRQPKSITRVAKPPTTPENPIVEPKVNPEKANVKPDPTPTSMTQPNGNNGVGPEKHLEEKVGELKDPKGVCENTSKKMVMRLKPSRNDVIKVLALVVGFVVGVYCAKLIQSSIV